MNTVNTKTKAEIEMGEIRNAMYSALTMKEELPNTSPLFTHMTFKNGEMKMPSEMMQHMKEIDFYVMLMMGLLQMQSKFMTFQQVYDLCVLWLTGAIDKPKVKPKEVKCTNDAKQFTLSSFEAWGEDTVKAYQRGLEKLTHLDSHKGDSKKKKSKKHRK